MSDNIPPSGLGWGATENLPPKPAPWCTYCASSHELEDCPDYMQDRTDDDEGAREGFDAPEVPEDTPDVDEARVRRRVEATEHFLQMVYPDPEAVARADIAIADEEQAVLHTMIETSEAHTQYWQARAEAAEAEVERLTRECLDREATETDARERLRRCEERLAALGDLIMDLGADLSGAQAKVTAVEALADRMDARFDHDYADAIRAALAGTHD